MTHAVEKIPVLVIHAHSRCNCRCVMCDIWKTTESREFSLEQLQSQMGAIERLGVEWVVFSGGEPLMHSDLFALTRVLRASGVRVTILSTGLLFSRFAREIAESIDDAIVSLDGPPAIHETIRRSPGGFGLMREGISAIHALRSEFRVTARCTVQKANHAELAATVDAAREIGLLSISFLAADLGSAAFGRGMVWPRPLQDEIALTPREIGVLEVQIEELLSMGGFVTDTPRHLRRIVRHFRAHLGLEEFEAPRCNAPWVSAVIETDGSVRPCFFHPVFTTTNSAELDAGLNSSAARKFRESLDIASNPICRTCVCSLYLPQTV